MPSIQRSNTQLPLKLFLIGIGIPLTGALLIFFVSQLPPSGSIAYLSFGFLILIAFLTITLIAIHIATIRNAEVTLKERNDELAIILSSIGEGLLVLDHDERIAIMNPAAESMLGFRLDAHRRPHINSVMTFHRQNEQLPAHHIPPLAALRERKNIKTMLHDDLTVQGTHHPFPVVGIASPLINSQAEQGGSVWIFRNVTTEKRIDESKTEFVSLASHQLKTPLTIINWYSELLLAGGRSALRGTMRTYAERISRGGNRMVDLVNELLTVSQIEEGRIRPTLQSSNIRSAIGAILEECSPLVRKQRGTLIFHEPPANLKAHIDPVLFSQSLMNIILNSLRYAGPNPCHIEIDVHTSKKGQCRITVKDRGIGIPDDAKEHIFEKFYRARNAIDAQSDGNGLGLYIAKRFLEFMDSELSFESQENKGATFTITIPMAR